VFPEKYAAKTCSLYSKALALFGSKIGFPESVLKYSTSLYTKVNCNRYPFASETRYSLKEHPR
jgi:hypothetical protein